MLLGWSGVYVVFFFNDTATTEIYTLSLHDALPICELLAAVLDSEHHAPGLNAGADPHGALVGQVVRDRVVHEVRRHLQQRSEEHTSELQSRQYLVCRLLLEKKIHGEHQHKLPPHQC